MGIPTIGATTPGIGLVKYTPFIGPVLDDIVGVLEILGVQIKGKTQHLTYDQVFPKAQEFGLAMWEAFQKAYKPAELYTIQGHASENMRNLMYSYWGLTEDLNKTIFRDLGENVTKQNELYRQFVLFALWVGVNVDAEMPDAYRTFFDNLFSMIFLEAIRQSGYRPEELSGTITVPTPIGQTPGTTPTAPSTGSSSSGEEQKAGMTKTLLILAGAGIIIYLLTR